MTELMNLLTGGAVIASLIAFVGQQRQAGRNETLQRELEAFKAETSTKLEDQRLKNQERLANVQTKLAEALRVQEAKHAKGLIDHQAPYLAQLETLKDGLTKVREQQKADLDKQGFVHELQFEKEFTIYQTFWERLIAVKWAANALRQRHEPMDAQRQREREKECDAAILQAVRYNELNRPFFQEAVYFAAKEVFATAQIEALQVGIGSDDHRQYWTAKAENIERIKADIEKVESAIRCRIGVGGKP